MKYVNVCVVRDAKANCLSIVKIGGKTSESRPRARGEGCNFTIRSFVHEVNVVFLLYTWRVQHNNCERGREGVGRNSTSFLVEYAARVFATFLVLFKNLLLPLN